jgi:hypothetical protein
LLDRTEQGLLCVATPTSDTLVDKARDARLKVLAVADPADAQQRPSAGGHAGHRAGRAQATCRGGDGGTPVELALWAKAANKLLQAGQARDDELPLTSGAVGLAIVGADPTLHRRLRRLRRHRPRLSELIVHL